MPTNRISLIVALCAVAAIAAFSMSMLPQSHPAPGSSSTNSYLQQRRGEWTAGVTSVQSYLEQRHGEQTTGRADKTLAAISQKAYQEYRHGEQTAGANPVLALLEYRRGEWSGK